MKLKDLVGEKFNKLHVVEKCKNKGKDTHAVWLCLCDCGNFVEVRSNDLISGKQKSCGCLKTERIIKIGKSNAIDISNRKFGKLTVIEADKKRKSKYTYWICECVCGNITSVRTYNLTSGKTSGCGKCNYVDILGNVYGKLTVISFSGTGKTGSKWLCQCECGNTKNILAQYLKSGKTTSCGCIGESSIASQLKKYFKEKYNAKTEYKILINLETKKHLPFDIYIPKYKLFIEIHGQQHYSFIEFFHKTIERFISSKNRDKLKRRYAKNHGTFIEIDIRKFTKTKDAIKYIEKFMK